MKNENIADIDLCDECKKYNEGKEKNEIRYCMECSKRIGNVYIQQSKKPMVDYLYDVMVERGMSEISCLNKEVLLEAAKRANSVVRRVNGTYLSTIMCSLRARDLFENNGKYYFPSIGKYCIVYKIKKQ